MLPRDEFAVEVRGLPKPAGSKRVFMVGKGAERRPVVTDDCKGGRDWRARLQDAFARAHVGEPWEGPITISVTFTLPRPRSHLKRDGSLRRGAPAYPAGRPDTTKLLRALEDAATGLLWHDDAQVVSQSVGKVYGDRPGVVMHCRRLVALKTGGRKRARI